MTGVTPAFGHEPGGQGSAILIGTIGRSRVIDGLVRAGRLDVSGVAGQWEAFVIQVVENPVAGISNALVIAGSDKRGTTFGIYDVSEQIGVSPWYWWADVPPKRSSALFVKAGRHVQGPPAVKYRGIFLNDEYPCLGEWAKEKFGGFNHAFYTNVFELLLRLKGNFLWPAMWNDSFATDDPLNPKLADEYGIVISTSHHEPMMRAWKEWGRAGNPPGSWDYSKNDAKLREFWAEGLRRTRDYEKVITLAMRGDGDEPMAETESVALLERIVADQRKLIAEIIHPDVTTVPQVWALYKEVQGYYERGMRVPDDVTLLWCDDNWGNIRRLPTPEERRRAGGAGIYYHFDYVGGPRNYKWLNTVPIPKIWEQMHLAWQYGADRIWVVNVGDLKPMEIPIEFFLALAWNPAAWPKERLPDYLRLWAEREFGPEHAAEIADIVARYTKYNGRRKPELLSPTTFSLLHYREAERVLEDWKEIAEKAERIHNALPESARDAFFQLVLHPTKACAIVNELYVTVGKNRLYAGQGRAVANDLAAEAERLFQADADLSRYYNRELAGGKWNHMMDQTHIGYTSWQQPPVNRMPQVRRVELSPEPRMGVTVEGASDAWPGGPGSPVLPPIDRFNRQRRYVEVFNKGQGAVRFTAKSDVSWIRVSPTEGETAKQERLWIEVNWAAAPAGSTNATVSIESGQESVQVQVPIFNPDAPKDFVGFIEGEGCVSMESVHFSRKVDTPTARWEPIADLGLTGSSMAVFPVTAPSVLPPAEAPRLEYDIYLFGSGDLEVLTVLGPSLNFVPGRGLRFAISLDDEPPQVVTVVPEGYFVDNGNRDWEESVRNSARHVRSRHRVESPGRHTLKIRMVDPGVLVQKVVINTGGVRPSCLGPPESFRQLVAQ
ncbi:MAG TPA: glycosyl hydrolase 115 family protein [Verrucomicrobiota bacterium]|nr:glycosyl hydrolase 115 family protein [Verrucomicrobiota bacterium]